MTTFKSQLAITVQIYRLSSYSLLVPSTVYGMCAWEDGRVTGLEREEEGGPHSGFLSGRYLNASLPHPRVPSKPCKSPPALPPFLLYSF